MKQNSAYINKPLEYAFFDGDPENFKRYFESIEVKERTDLFSSVVHYYSKGPDEKSYSIFSFERETNGLLIEEVSPDIMKEKLDSAEKRREANQKAYSDSILKSRKKQEENPDSAEPEKSSLWSWLKI